MWARPEQLPPPGNWTTWLVLAGRGFGKTRCGAEWVRQQVKSGYRRIALVAETQRDLEKVMIEGDSGILAVCPPHERPKYTKKPVSLVFPNGAICEGFNGTEPDQLRGPNFDAAWCDELAKWRYAKDTWDMLQFGLRLGDNPHQLVTTTPRPIATIQKLLKDKSCVVTRGKTTDNRGNLPQKFLDEVLDKYTGTRLGRQELDAEVLDDIPGALWTRSRLDSQRVTPADAPTMERIVVGVDPAAKKNGIDDDGASTGIVVCARGADKRGYVLDDATCRESPDGWARIAIAMYDRYNADCIVAEINQGGDMVKSTLRAVRPEVPVREITSYRGKWLRAEPIAALYEQGRIRHVGTFAALEDEMVLFGPNGLADGMSPDHVDALVHGMTELFPSMTRRVDNQHVEFETTAGYNPLEGRYSR